MIFERPRILPFGEAALLIEYGDEIGDEVNRRVHTLDALLAAASPTGLVETTPGYCSLLVEYDPLRLPWTGLIEALSGPIDASLAAGAEPGLRGSSPEPKQIPTAYGGEYGPDLDGVAAAHGLSPADVVRIHGETVYTVYMLGFSPGFAYLGSVPEVIATPRLTTPRTLVPAGSVGIAGRQTGIYPQATPGGWRLLGRTAISLFDAHRDPPAWLAPGDRVRFVPVPGLPAVSPGGSSATPPPPDAGQGGIEVISSGLLTTVQDLGRRGYQRYGVPVCGAMDPFAARCANALVGNRPEAPLLEATVSGPVLRFRQDALVAITGGDLQCLADAPDLGLWEVPAWMSLYLRAGAVLECRSRRAGCRAYIAVAGGIRLPEVMGSAATCLAAGFGGYRGRALQEGDGLAVGKVAGHLASGAGRWLPPVRRPAYDDRPTVRVVLGPQDDSFTPEALRMLFSQSYQVKASADRMGLRLSGPPLARAGAREAISGGVVLGAIQVPPDGQPIILMADRQTAGGYPVIATVILNDIPLLAQCLPGLSSVRFEAVSLDEAQAIYRATSEAWRPDEPEPAITGW